MRAELLAEPGGVALRAGVPLRGPHALALGEALLDTIAGYRHRGAVPVGLDRFLDGLTAVSA